MPLMKSKSKRAFEHNVKAELKAGKPRKQALAIAYATQRRAGKAHGGVIGETSMMDRMKQMMQYRKMRKMSEGGMVYPDADYSREMQEFDAMGQSDFEFPPTSPDRFPREGEPQSASPRKAILDGIMRRR